MKRNTPFLIAALFLLTAVALQITFSFNRLEINPITFDGDLVVYSDSSKASANGGNSTVELDSVTEEGVFYRYQLNKQFSYYYAGLQFIPNKKPLDLTKYSHVKIDINCERSSSVRFFILTHEPDHSLPKDITTWRHFREVIPLKRDGSSSYTLQLDKFHTPQWWFETYNTSEPLLLQNPMEQVLAFKFESGEGEPTGINESVQIKGLRFFTPVPSAVRSVQTALIILTILILAFRFGIMKRVQLGKYKPVVLGNLFDEDLEKISDYIGESYPNSELSLNMVAAECGMHPEKVTALIRQGYGQTFKQYLNRLRLTEAQRLLRSTDRQISEIAFAVGYNSVSHFNRVFKQFFSCTPREYRS